MTQPAARDTSPARSSPARPSINHFVHRVLVRRLVLTGILVAALTGALVFIVRVNMLGGEVVEDARNNAALLAYFAAEDMRAGKLDYGAALAQGIKRFQALPRSQRQGQYASALLYDGTGKILHEQSRPDAVATAAAAAIRAMPRRFPAADAAPWELLAVNDTRVLRITSPLLAGEGTIAAYVDGAFTLSEEGRDMVRAGTLAAAGSAVALVLITTLLLYPVVLKLTRRVVASYEALLDSNLETLSVLGSAIAKRDSDTNTHNFRVTIASVRLGEALGLDDDRMRSLIKGAFLHDVGKIGVRDAVLLKPGKLGDEEFAIMRTHVDHGLDIVGRCEWLSDAADTVGAHHEKFDGTGYPRRLAGANIPLNARIFAVIDVFDALTSKRPYKEPFPLERALDILREGAGSHFDPEIVAAFVAIAPALHGRFGAWGEEELQAEVKTIVATYFTARLDRLLY
jgi:HD-GYP domain-containing protein (c-di-GMP phosphodiesterase class II)